jgi:Tfp pilus assembly protein PilO
MQRVYDWLVSAPILHKFGLLFFLMGGIVGYYYMYPLDEAHKMVAKSQKKLKYARRRISSSKNKLKEAKKAKMELNDIKEKGDKLSGRIPTSVDMSELVGELDKMADDIQILHIKPLDDDVESYSTVIIKPIKFSVKGRFHNISRFLYKMFQMKRLMDVGDITLEINKMKDEKESLAMLEASFVARIYYSPKKEVKNPLKPKKKR